MKKPHKEKNKKSLQQNDLNRSESETDISAQVTPTNNFARGYTRGIGPTKRATKVGWTSENLTSEILLRLPEKSVARFRCVSKLWLSITTDPYFIKLFETRSSQPSLLVCFFENEKLFVASIPQHLHSLQNSKRSYSCSQLFIAIIWNFQEDIVASPLRNLSGLICFQVSGTPIVWNPSTRQLLPLPKPRLSWNDLTIFLGYDPVECKHKVMCIPLKRSSDVCRVLTLGSAQKSWKTVKTQHKHRSDNQTCGRCIKGVVYYIAEVYQTHVWVVMSFDVRSEKFDMIQLPSDTDYRSIFLTYEESFACVQMRTTKGGQVRGERCTTLCILEDAKKHKWSSKDVFASAGLFVESLRTVLKLKGCSHAGEFIYASSGLQSLSYILFHDPVKRSCRRFELKGIADDTSRLNNE
ncbi:LOW QUALITY PROTEIN: putative F-box protein At1g47765, partial [Capsella rubella]|uniref:LOW QUALITY PROTEIN: putative F-box protein At1g47765 n=1 Tax=Capsella rubella TaxID=81985 RepID=UPI000CD4AB88